MILRAFRNLHWELILNIICFIYSFMQVEKERLKDAAEGINIAQILDGFVKRKVIKQTVMTTVYGVTRFGGRLQIAKQLKG